MKKLNKVHMLQSSFKFATKTSLSVTVYLKLGKRGKHTTLFKAVNVAPQNIHLPWRAHPNKSNQHHQFY